MRFEYQDGQTQARGQPVKVTDLPTAINHHWTKALAASAGGRFLYVGIGSNSNITERGMTADVDRAMVWQVDVQTGAHKPYATGLRNPTALAIQTSTNQLWAVVNERDEIGPDLVPDYLTSVREGAFYGWPYSYWGQNVDTRVRPQDPDKVRAAIAPDYSLGSHVAALGVAFSAPTMGESFAAACSSAARDSPKGPVLAATVVARGSRAPFVIRPSDGQTPAAHDCQHSKSKAESGRAESSRNDRPSQPMPGDHQCGAGKCSDGIKVALEHNRCARDQQVAHDASSYARQHAQQRGHERIQPECKSLRGTRDSKEREASRIEQQNRQVQPGDRRVPEEDRQPGQDRDRAIAPVSDRCRRRRTDQKIAHDSARAGRGKRKYQHAEDVELLSDTQHRPADREDERAGEIEYEE
jgi:hypothetical protein